MKIELSFSPTKEDVFKISFDMITGIITTVDNEGLVNQEKHDSNKLPHYIKATINKALSDWEENK